MTILQVPQFLQTGLTAHGFSTRLGGVSQGEFAGLNLGLYNGDEEQAVQENRRQFLSCFSCQPSSAVSPQQVHQTEISVVTQADGGKGVLSAETALKNVDGLITNEKNIGLLLCFADCTPLFFWDPVEKVIALAHAGWKGTAAAIGAKTVTKMQRLYHSQPENILAAIGPSIGPCHYEVDHTVAEQFRRSFAFSDDVLTAKNNGKYWLDLWQANRQQLLSCGLTAEHITVSDYCTACYQELFYSYRASGGKTGRMAAFMMITP